MLVPAPYKVPEKKAKKKAKGAKSGPCRKGASDVSFEDKTHSSTAEDDDEEEEESNSPPDGGRKKRAAPTNLEAEAPKRGKGPLAAPRGTSTAAQSDAPEASPWPHRTY